MRTLLGFIALTVLWLPGLAPAEDANRSDASLVIFTRGFGAGSAGNAVAIGDGSLAVTARHVLYGYSRPNTSQSLGIIVVLSPYLGELAEARIVAEDAALDLAIVQLPWTGHPAVMPASRADIAAATEADVESRFDVIRALVNDDLAGAADAAAAPAQVLRLPVDYVGSRAGVGRIVKFATAGGAGKGWSGSPVFLPDSAQLVGGVSTASFTSPLLAPEGATLAAFHVDSIVGLLEQGGLLASLKPAAGQLPRAADAKRLVRLFIEHEALNAANDPAGALARTEALRKARPDNPLYALYVAAARDKLGHAAADIEAIFRDALKLDPRSILGRLLYAQFLQEQKRPADAMALLEDPRRTDPRNPNWVLKMSDLLAEQSRHGECVRLAEEALAHSPDDARLHAMLGQARKNLGQHAAAAQALRRAAELDETKPQYRMMLAQELEADNQLDPAEAEYRRLANEHAPSAHFLLGNFLAKHRPSRAAEALAEFDRELAGPAGLVPRDVVERVRESLFRRLAAKEKNVPTPATFPSRFGL